MCLPALSMVIRPSFHCVKRPHAPVSIGLGDSLLSPTARARGGTRRGSSPWSPRTSPPSARTDRPTRSPRTAPPSASRRTSRKESPCRRPARGASASPSPSAGKPGGPRGANRLSHPAQCHGAAPSASRSRGRSMGSRAIRASLPAAWGSPDSEADRSHRASPVQGEGGSDGPDLSCGRGAKPRARAASSADQKARQNRDRYSSCPRHWLAPLQLGSRTRRPPRSI